MCSFDFRPGESWEAWTRRVRSLARKCGKSPSKWQLAATQDVKLAMWAAKYALHKGIRGGWMSGHVSDRKACLNKLMAGSELSHSVSGSQASEYATLP